MQNSLFSSDSQRMLRFAWPGIALYVLALCVGCASDEAPKSSHFEHDHEVAEHWPQDLEDAIFKMRERLAWLDHGHEEDEHEHEEEHDHDHEHEEEHDHEHEHEEEHEHEHEHEPQPVAELADLIAWVPEIAADTNLPESDWNVIDEAATALSRDFDVSLETIAETDRKRVQSLCELIEQSLSKIPEQLPMYSEVAK